MVGRRGFVEGVAAGVAAGAAAATWRELPRLDAFEPPALNGHRVERAASHLGAVAVRMRAPDGTTYQIDILRKGAEAGLRDTRRYSLFLANRGDGRKATDESQGLALIALGEWLDASDPKLPALLTFDERRLAHPGGLFLLT